MLYDKATLKIITSRIAKRISASDSAAAVNLKAKNGPGQARLLALRPAPRPRISISIGLGCEKQGVALFVEKWLTHEASPNTAPGMAAA